MFLPLCFKYIFLHKIHHKFLLLLRLHSAIPTGTFFPFSFNQLVEIDEIGESIAESLVNYFANSENTALIDRLRARGLKFALQEEEMSSTLEGLSFVISGTFTLFSRDELKKQIEKHSGRVISSISSKVDYVICGENMGPQKKKKAEDLGIKMIDQYEFAKMIDPEKASDK